ncbi:uncharacterized protein LTR77_007175 [Saxophila tyrrhenica]|uniref:Uncharacterized protein n=1 Tax=Saxophila tyrrhenica TaxID=1690608 RepID=A0AAV9P416_9PEZI|nr:hypothetical protein LTR77_007175 [Saxophila tyrrhenica]
MALANLTTVTLYGPGHRNGPCDPDAAPGAIVGNGGKCYNSTWGYYSLDLCTKQRTTRKPTTIQTSTKGTSSSTSSSPPSSTSSTPSTISTSSASTAPTPSHTHSNDQGDGTNVGAIAGGVVGGVAFGVIAAVVGILMCLRRRKAKRNQLPEYSGAPGSSHGLADIATKELPSNDYFHDHDSRLGSPRGAPGTPGGAQELSNEGIPEMASYPLVELPDKEHRAEMGTKSPVDRKGHGGL